MNTVQLQDCGEYRELARDMIIGGDLKIERDSIVGDRPEKVGESNKATITFPMHQFSQ